MRQGGLGVPQAVQAWLLKHFALRFTSTELNNVWPWIQLYRVMTRDGHRPNSEPNLLMKQAGSLKGRCGHLVLSPVLLNVYMCPLTQWAQRFGLGCCQYSDDTQLHLLLDGQLHVAPHTMAGNLFPKLQGNCETPIKSLGNTNKNSIADQVPPATTT